MTLHIVNTPPQATPENEVRPTEAAVDLHQPSDAPTILERTLAAAQECLTQAQAQIAWLVESNTRLRHQVVALAHLETQSRHDAYYDTLTCLPNRRLLLDRLNQALGQAIRQHKQVVLLLLDIDGFKAVNDRFGHAAGDKVLRAVAERLVACIRTSDTACRYGGDEFVVMLPEINADDCARVERKIRERLATPYFIDGVEVSLGVSIGSAVFPVHAKNRSALLEHADRAMYRAKRREPGRSGSPAP